MGHGPSLTLYQLSHCATKSTVKKLSVHRTSLIAYLCEIAIYVSEDFFDTGSARFEPAHVILVFTVNSEIFARVLFSRNFMRSFVKIKSSRNWEITLSITDIGKSCSGREFLAQQECLLTLFVKIKFSRKFRDLQYRINKQLVLTRTVSAGNGGPYVFKKVGGGRFADFITFFINIPWKWNNLVSLIPNYFIFIGYSKTRDGKGVPPESATAVKLYRCALTLKD